MCKQFCLMYGQVGVGLLVSDGGIKRTEISSLVQWSVIMVYVLAHACIIHIQATPLQLLYYSIHCVEWR